VKAAVFGLVFVPGIMLAAGLASGSLGPRPTEAMVHGTGLWTIRLLLASLAVTPLLPSVGAPSGAALR
jgi:sulfoxide reductase heme-binding subunit YedZ